MGDISYIHGVVRRVREYPVTICRLYLCDVRFDVYAIDISIATYCMARIHVDLLEAFYMRIVIFSVHISYYISV